MAHMIGQKRNYPFETEPDSQNIKQLKLQPPIDVVNYVPKVEHESDSDGDGKAHEEKTSNESAYWSSISTPEKPVLKHSTESILKPKTPPRSEESILSRFPLLQKAETSRTEPEPVPGLPFLPGAPAALTAFQSSLYNPLFNPLLFHYTRMLKHQQMRPWPFQHQALSPVAPIRPPVTTSSDSGSDQEAENSSRPVIFSTPIRSKTNSSKTADSGIGELLSDHSKSEKFQSSISNATPPSASESTPSPSDPAKKRTTRYNCKQCDYQAPSLTALKTHLREHDLPCKCPICFKGFTRQWLLEGHIRTHNGEKPFSCDVCGRAFADRSNMRSHRATHDPQRRYTCPHCNKSFSRKSVLQKHMSNRVCLKRKSDPMIVASSSHPSLPSSSE